MQFKHPEILYALFALLIPIFIHLFQLQRFVKIPFTNVKFLKQLELQTRKSSKIKKFLILMSRMLALVALIFAFAQPYLSKSDELKEKETIFFVDNSLSMQANGITGQLFKNNIRELIENLPEKGNFSLLTHDDFLENIDRQTLKDFLMTLDFSEKSKPHNDLIMRIKQRLNRIPNLDKKMLWISDFQKQEKAIPNFKGIKTDLVFLKSEKDYNLKIDSVYINEVGINSNTIKIKLSNIGKSVEKVDLSAFNKNILLAKTNISIPENGYLEVPLNISGNSSEVKIQIDYEDAYHFDNEYYITFNTSDKIKITNISKEPNFLKKIFTDDEFILNQITINQLDNRNFETSNLIIFQDIDNLPESFFSSIQQFIKKGGSIAFLPSEKQNVENLNLLFNFLKMGFINHDIMDSLLVNTIHFDHPLLKNVFEKKVSNFQYPFVKNYFEGVYKNDLPILSFQNSKPFISQFQIDKGKFFWFSASLDEENSNFKQSPLIVPIFYNMAKMSVIQDKLAYRIGEENDIAVPVKLFKDQVLTINSEHENFIPMQQIYAENVRISTLNEPKKAGFYKILMEEKVIKLLAFNASVTESEMNFWNPDDFKSKTDLGIYTSTKSALEHLKDWQYTHSFFQWFIGLAILFLLIEIALIKLM